MPIDLNRLDALLDQDAAERARAASAGAPAVAPDAMAQALRLSRQTGAPAQAIAADPAPFEQDAHLATVQETTRTRPALADWLASDPAHAALARDEVPALVAVHDAAAPGTRRSWLGAVAASLFGNPGGEVGDTIAEHLVPASLGAFTQPAQAATDLLAQGANAGTAPLALAARLASRDAARRGDTTAARALAAQADAFTDGSGLQGAADHLGGINRAIADEQAALGAQHRAPTSVADALAHPTNALAHYAGAFTDSLPAMLLAMATRNPEAASGMIGATTGAQTYTADINGDGDTAPTSRLTALVDATAQGGLEAGGEMFPFEAAFKPGASRFIATPFIEGTSEALTQVAQTSTGDAVRGNEITPFDQQIGQALDAFVVGHAMGLSMASLGGGHADEDPAHAPTRWFQAARAQVDRDYLAKVMAAAKAAKLRQRAPAAFEDLLQRQVGDTVVHVPAEQLNALFQSERVPDPAGAVTTLTGDPTAWAEALATGGTVAIPLARYATYLADAHSTLAPHVALDADTALAAEDLKAAGVPTPEQFQADLAKAMEAAQTATARDTGEAGQVYDHFYGQLLGTTDEVNAAHIAATMQALYTTWGERTGIAPAELLRRFQININRPAEAARGAPRDVDLSLDPVIDAALAGSTFTDTELRGPSLIPAIIAAGGINPDSVGGADLKAGDALKRPGLLSLTGKTAEAMAEEFSTDPDWAAHFTTRDEHGRADYREFLDLIRAELGGTPLHAIPADQRSADRVATREAFRRDTETVAAAIRQHAEAQGVEPSAMPRETLRALAHDALSGEDALAQPAYHGSPHRFDRFSLQYIGTGEGAQAYGWGLYFTGKREIAEWYRRQLSEGTGEQGAVFVNGERLDDKAPENHAARLIYYNDAREMKRLAGQMVKEAQAGEPYTVETAAKVGLDPVTYYTRLADFIRTHKRSQIKVERGQLYQVEIPDDEHLLDNDGKIASQPAKVQEVARAFLRAEGYLREGENGPRQLASAFREAAMALGGMVRGADGQTLYSMLAKKLGSEQAASQYLNEHGIPGLKFKAGQLTPNVRGSSTNYVIWDENALGTPQALYQGALAPTGERSENYAHEEQILNARLADWADTLHLGSGGPRAVDVRPEDLGAVDRRADHGGAVEQGDASRADIAEQSHRLIERAKADGFFWGSDSPILFALQHLPSAGGAEHQVFMVGHGDDRLIIRATDNGYFGPRADISPAQYLARLEDYSRTFPDLQTRLIGVSESPDVAGHAVIWTAQRFVRGQRLGSQSALVEAFAQQGWEAVGDPYSYEFRHTASGATIADAHTDNVYQGENGALYPFDVVVTHLAAGERESSVPEQGADYRGEHRAPNHTSGDPLFDLTRSVYPDDIYGPRAAQYYGHHGGGHPMDRATVRLLQAYRNEPDAPIKIYRAVPKGVTGINPGDWVTINRDYALEHGQAQFGDDAHIVEMTVKARDLYTNGDSIHEWGYDPAGLDQSASAEPFYSQLLRTVETGQGAPKAADAAAWKGWLDGAQRRGELRKGERDWLGVDAWLDAQDGKVTRAQLADFIRANQVQVQDVVLGEDPAPQIRDQIDRINDEFNAIIAAHGVPRHEIGGADGERLDELEREHNRLADEALPNARDTYLPPKFGGYQLPGGTNYRELLLTLPARDRGATEEEIASLNQRLTERGYGPLDEEDEADLRAGGTPAIDRLDDIHARVGVPTTDLRNALSGGDETATFRSSHFDQPNIVAHVRFNDRVDADGKRVLFLEEIQSDWHQAGRKKGYRANGEDAWTRMERQGYRVVDATTIEPDFTGWMVLDNNGDPVAEGATREAAIADYLHNDATPHEHGGGWNEAGVPDAPFKATDEWAMLAFKRMVRWAAENGYDRIAWTTGAQQAERYDLSKQIHEVLYSPYGDGTFEVTATDHNGSEIRGAAGRKNLEQIEALFGKEIAEKIRDGVQDREESGAKILTGDNLKVGGEGMRAFYDQILPAAVNKWAKKFGGKVGEAHIATGEPNPLRTRIASDGKVFWVAAGSEGNDVPLSPEFPTIGEAYAAQDRLRTGAKPQHALTLTPEMRAAALAGLPMFQRGQAAGPRGQIVGRDGQSIVGQAPDAAGTREFNISLLAGADLSTFLHEGAHAFLEMFADLAADPNAPAQLREDWAKVLAYLGVTDRGQIGREQHETWARSFEAYAREGKAPSSALRRAFAAFRTWLTHLYRSAAALNVSLTDEVRGVFDRMLATDAEIAHARSGQYLQPLITDAVEFGMTPEQHEAYQRAVQAAVEQAEATLTAEVLRAQQQAQAAWWHAEKRRVRASVEADLRQAPVYRAMRWLRQGLLPDGTPVPRPLKLDKAALVDLYGKAFPAKKLTGLYAVEGGVHPDVAAAALGYPSGAALVEALVTAPKFAEAVAADVERIMRERHPDPLTDGSLPARAAAAVETDHQARLMVRELQAIEAKAKTPGPPTALEVMRQVARQLIAGKRAAELAPHVYRAAEAKAGREAFAAAAKGDWAAAGDARRRQLLNLLLAQEATRVQREMQQAGRFLRNWTKAKRRAALGKAGADYLAQVDGLLERFDFKLSGKAAARRERLAVWLDQQLSQGIEVNLPEELRDEAFRKPFVHLNVVEVRALRDAVKHLTHLATVKNRLTTARGLVEWQAARALLLERLEQQRPRGARGPSAADRTALQAVHDLGSEAGNWVLQPETIVEWLDGGTAGPWHDLLWEQSEAAEHVRTGLQNRVGALLQAAFEAIPAAERKALDAKHRIASLGGAEVSGHTILSAALNMGNAGNRDKLLRGGRVVGDEVVPFTPEQLAEMFTHLTRGQAQLVQGIWDAVNALWPDIVALEKATNGLPPEKVEATPVTLVTRDGPVALRGGYFPAMYDPRGSRPGQTSADEQAKRMLAGQGPIRATTPKGHIEARTEYAAPLLLDYHQVLSRHLDGVMADISYRGFLRQMYRVLTDAEIARKVDNRLGPGALRALKAGFERGAVGSFSLAGPLWGPFQGLADATMTNISAAALGLRVPLAFANIVTAPILASARLSVPALVRGFAAYYANPWAATRQVQALSPMMAKRAQARSVELSSILADLRGHTSARKQMIEFTMAVHQWIVPLAENAIWLAAYQHASRTGADRLEAVRQADKVIRQTQTKHQAKDLAVAEANPYLRPAMLFAGPLVVINNRLQEAGLRGRFRGAVHTPVQALAAWVAMAAGGSWLYELIMGRGPGDDDDDGTIGPGEWALWCAKKLALLPFAAYPVLRDVVAALDGGGAARPSPLVDAAQSLAQFGKQAVKAGDALIHGEPVDTTHLASSATKAAGVATGLPTNQLVKTGRYLMEVGTGQHTPDNPAAEAYYFWQGPPRAGHE